MLLKQLFDHNSSTLTYLLADPTTREAVIIDPVLEHVDRDLKLVAELGLELIYTLDTHIHADHITGSGEIRDRIGALSGVSAVSGVECADHRLVHGDFLHFGNYSLEVRATPGHTNGCLTFVVNDGARTLAFTGDALLIRGCGRTDFQEGSAATLYRSVHEQIYTLPAGTIIFPGHDYRGHRSSTVEEEKKHNPRLALSIEESTFIATMKGLNLSHPKRIHEALPANMACGREEKTGGPMRSFKEIEVDALGGFAANQVVDVRSPEEFQSDLTSLPGARLAPLPELKTLAAHWRREEPLLLVCRTGRRSAQACELLSGMGFSDVTNLVGGMAAWHAQGEARAC